MRSFKFLLMATAMGGIAPGAASAAVIGSLADSGGAFLTLSEAGLDGGAVATLTGGTIYNSDRSFADFPAGTVFGNRFLAAGPQAGQPATLTFTAPVSYLSFLWGSPDTYNQLSITTDTGATYAFDVNNLGFSVRDGNQDFSQYVQFAATAGESITSVSFTNAPATDAFEVANFSIAAVPEPATWAMMLVGFGMVGAASRYRRRSMSARIA